ncbi:MAG: VOC family protein [Fimbriimonadaceae bacterium]|nr:VOC family protein [Fimbriimonadaceae bacterium]
MIRGLNHLTLAVREVPRAVAFYVELLGLTLCAQWPQGAYLLAGDLWIALHQDDLTHPGPWPEYTHLAFDVAAADFAAFTMRLRSAGVREWQANQTEGDSLYFLDPDGHKLEIHCNSLQSRLESARQAPWPGLQLLR